MRDRSGYVRGYLPYLSFDIPLFFRMLLSRRPDVVLVEPPPTTGVIARLACMLRRVPYVWYAADIWSDAAVSTGAHPLVIRAVRAMERFAVAGAAGVIAISDPVGERAKALGARSVQVIPNGIDTDLFSPRVVPLSPDELREIGIVRPYFVYAGTASEWQRAEEFAKALVGDHLLLDEAQILFVGNGSSWPVLEEIRDAAKDRGTVSPIVLLDSTQPARVAQLLRGAVAALVSVAPGKDYDFAYPTKVLAALASGTRVLYAGPGPARADIEAGPFGLAVDLEETQIQEAMLKLLDSEMDTESALRAHEWVVNNRSLIRTGREAFEVLGEVADAARDK